MRVTAGTSIFVGVMVAALVGSAACAQDIPYDINQIQHALVTHGYNIGSVDGLWGRRSINALAAFQKAHGLRATGELNDVTVKRLLESPQPQAATPALPPPAFPAIGTSSPTFPLLPIPAPPQAVMVEQALPAPLSESTPYPTGSAVPSAATPSPQAIPASIPSESLEAIRAGALAAGAVAIAIAVILLFVRRRRTARIARDARGSFTGYVNAAANARLSPAPTSKNSGAHPEVNLTIKPDQHSAERPSQDNSLQLDGWIPANQPVTVGNYVIPGGFIYIGNRLPQIAHVHRAENCLINPRLAIASRGDPGGHTVGYCPSYSEITAEARRSYLDWLAGPRSDPSTYIGYVFLYFYGLERRLMLEKGAPDPDAIISEVRRLMQVHASHNSFCRCAQDLLSAYELQEAREPETIVPSADTSGYEVPLSIKAALGARVRDGQPIESDLLLAYVMSHPQVSVRTPAKRALGELRQLFQQELSKRHPAGFVISASRAKKLTASYRACSGTFEVELRPYGGELPDISGYSRLLNVGRELLESCTVQLEDYSRTLGRASGSTPTLAVLARLPSSLRRQQADLMAAASMKTLDSLCDDATPSDPEQLLSLVGTAGGPDVNRAKLRELAGILAAFGYGITADPAFAVLTTKANEPVVVFRLSCPVDASTDLAPTPRYAQVQATLMLALLVATADGTLDDRERQGLMARIDAATELPEDERRRLVAELVAQASTPGRVTDWMKRLMDLEASDSERVADILVAAAAADGRIDPSEVTLLEKVFARLGLEASALYTRLHGSIAVPTGGPDDDLRTVLPPGKAPKTEPIPPPPPVDSGGRAVHVDLSRLDAIRRETRSASNVLADIFAEEDDTPEPEAIAQAVPEPTEDAIFEGLEGRYGCLLADLAERNEWTLADFEHLTRRAGLMPAAARQVLNEWSFDRFDEPVLEGEDVIIINRYVLPQPGLTSPSVSFIDSRASV